MKDIEFPEPVGFRSRYRSEPWMIGHYPWTYADHRWRKYDRPECEYEDLYTADQLRAAVEADRAQRVPHQVYLSGRTLIDAARRDWPSTATHRARVLEAASALESALLASTPAPAQQERKPTLPPGHCASDWGGRPTGPCLYTDDEVIEILAAQHQEPPQQERKPMTDKQRQDLYVKAHVSNTATARQAFYEGMSLADRHHGIKE